MKEPKTFSLPFEYCFYDEAVKGEAEVTVYWNGNLNLRFTGDTFESGSFEFYSEKERAKQKQSMGYEPHEAEATLNDRAKVVRTNLMYENGQLSEDTKGITLNLVRVSPKRGFTLWKSLVERLREHPEIPDETKEALEKIKGASFEQYLEGIRSGSMAHFRCKTLDRYFHREHIQTAFSGSEGFRDLGKVYHPVSLDAKPEEVA